MGARHVRANGIRFSVLSQGPEDGPLALCLHGFPDHALTWRHLLPRLADAGYRAVAPWMRGYAPTEVPPEGDYSLNTLAADINSLHRALGGDDRAVLIGHDWGAMAGYRAAAAAPDRWRRVVAMAVAPEPALRNAVAHPRQALRSWYIALLQVPGAERLVARNDMALIDKLWRDWSPNYEREPQDRDPLKATLRSPGSLRAAIQYYRDLAKAGARGDYPSGSINPPQPVLYLHGDEDGALGVDLASRASDVLDPPSRMQIIHGTGHFLHLEAPDRVADEVLGFLNQ